MSSNYSISQLAMGLTMPIKMRNIIDRPKSGQLLAFNQLLAHIVDEKMYAKDTNKENTSDPNPR
jgi:hypothetical protein